MCGSRKCPYLPQGWCFGLDPPSPWNFQFCSVLSLKISWLLRPPPPRNFQWPSLGWVWIHVFSVTKQFFLTECIDGVLMASALDEQSRFEHWLEHYIHCSWARHSNTCTLIVPLSAQVLANECLRYGVTLWWTSIPPRGGGGGRNNPSQLMLMLD